MPSRRLAWEAEFLHTVTQGAALKAQERGGGVRPADHLLGSRSICDGSNEKVVLTTTRPYLIRLTKSDTDGEVIFAEDSQSANQLIERAPSIGSGLFQTSPSVSKVAKSRMWAHWR
jgi:hypothetical protein